MIKSASLEKPTNLYEFIIAIGDFTNDLSNEQKNFKELLSYLHGQKFLETFYEQLGIQGFDGENVTNRESFRESYQQYFLKGKEKDRYDLFLEMYNGIELFGIVKGKPKKQKLMNMVNDGRHAFYGAFCDVVVSSDIDFIAKAKFLYDIHEIRTPVYTLKEYESVLKTMDQYSKLKLADLIKEIHEVPEERLIHKSEKGLTYRLSSPYFSYFDIAKFIYSEDVDYCYVTSENTNLLSGTIANEFEFVTSRIVSELGPDINGKTNFDRSEIKTGDWEGRRWVLEKTVFELSLHNKLCLSFYPIEYLQK